MQRRNVKRRDTVCVKTTFIQKQRVEVLQLECSVEIKHPVVFFNGLGINTVALGTLLDAVQWLE